MSWVAQRGTFQARFDQLATENIQGLITDLNTAVGNFVSKGGLSKEFGTDPDYNSIQLLTTRAETIKQKYTKLNADILDYLKK